MTETMQETELTLEAHAVGAYLGLAVGDALGATTEFLTPREIQEKYGIHRKICGGGWLCLKPGQVTDDTQMSLALGQAILDSQGVAAESVAQAFSEWMRSKPVDIGNTVRRGLIHFRTTGEPFVAESEYDAGNGACMRSLPVALYYWNASTKDLAQASRIQSHVTHNSLIADAGTEAVLQMLVSAFRGERKEALWQIASDLVDRHRSYRFDKRKVENPSGWIVETLKVVFQAFFAHDSFEEILVDVVNRGGDADTTGAIAGMLAGAVYGPDSIPMQWIKTLDQDVRRACEKQSLELLALAAKQKCDVTISP
ncbi:MAG: ADP-ribosyl-[dinitrogen reductase] hydrolase [Candidatus Thiodiazotropha sp.]